MDRYAECRKLHSHIGGKADGCQEFRESLSSPSKCDVCSCDRSYHRKVVYSQCNKIHDLKIPNSVDGCQEFMPAGPAAGDDQWLKCKVCSCHRNFHRKEVVVTNYEIVSTAGGCAVPFEVKKERMS